MGLTASNFRLGVARIQSALPGLEAELNAADAELGDGDTGGMVARLVNAIASAVNAKPGPDIGETLGTAARAAASATGSSLGTLIVIGLMAVSRETKGRDDVAWREVGPALLNAAAAMFKRGGANPGDKTAVDVLLAVGDALSNLSDESEAADAAQSAAAEAITAFRDRPCKIGRGRIFQERSVGRDDPGMLAFVRMIDIAVPAGVAR